MTMFPLHIILIYTFTLWFGLYLLIKHPQNIGMRFAGSGILAYALSLALYMIAPFVTEISAWNSLILLLPSAFWYGAITHLLQAEYEHRHESLIIISVALLIGSLIALEIISFTVAPLVSLVILTLALIRLWRIWNMSAARERSSLATVFTATIFLGLGVSAFLLPSDLLPSDITVLGIGFDLALLGAGIAALDAYHAGERLRPDFVRSLVASMLIALIFGGQVVMFIAIEKNFSPGMLVLLLTIISAGVAFQTLYEDLQNLFDRFALPHPVHQERAELRQAVDAVSRVDREIDWSRMDEPEFTRLTRRALSNLGDLGKLASSPLTRLPMIDEAMLGKQDNILERAATLKALLIENIIRLKPRDIDEDFGTTDEWRYYNALYFPYVVGIKPFSRRNMIDDKVLDETSLQALEWFKTYIPERTLYNWQNAAAQIIAQSLWEEFKQI